MNLSLLCVICILQITSADDRYRSRRQSGVGRRQNGGAADDETRSALQGGGSFRKSRSRTRQALRLLNSEYQNIREDSDGGRARKGVKKGIRKTAKKKGNKNRQGWPKQQILTTLDEVEPVPIVKVRD